MSLSATLGQILHSPFEPTPTFDPPPPSPSLHALQSLACNAFITPFEARWTIPVHPAPALMSPRQRDAVGRAVPGDEDGGRAAPMWIRMRSPAAAPSG